MSDSILVLTIYFLAVLAPVLIPATVHAVHFIRDSRHSYRGVRTAGRLRVLRPVVSRRIAVPAAA